LPFCFLQENLRFSADWVMLIQLLFF